MSTRNDWGVRPGFVLDTAALIELQTWGSKLYQELKRALREDMAILVPAPVLVEWLAGNPTINKKRIYELVDIVELTEELAKLAAAGLHGAAHQPCETCGVRGGPSVVDAVVMALAHQGGDTIYTQDPKDLEALRPFFGRASIKRC